MNSGFGCQLKVLVSRNQDRVYQNGPHDVRAYVRHNKLDVPLQRSTRYTYNYGLARLEGTKHGGFCEHIDHAEGLVDLLPLLALHEITEVGAFHGILA